MAGRKPKPTAIRELHGNVGHRPINKNEPKFSGVPVCPTWLPGSAKTEWNRIVTQLEELDMLKATDQQALAAYCVAFSRWQTAERIVNREGQTVKEPVLDKTGTVIGHKVKRHPATIIAKDERTSMLKAASLFGFDPSSRSRVQIPEKKETPEHDNFDDDLYAEDSSGVVH
jgi:P27 family predicted phage terminase small subunit